MAKNQKTRVICVLGGGLKKQADGTWRTCRLNEGDGSGITGDRLRIEAAGILNKKFLSANITPFFIASGGKGRYATIADLPPLAEIIKKELVASGIPANRILEENQSRSTFHELELLKQLALKKRLTSMAILSNGWHLPRIKAMLTYFPKLRWPTVKLLSAEAIILAGGSKAQKIKVKKFIGGKLLTKRLINEQNGIKQIKNGTYRLR